MGQRSAKFRLPIMLRFFALTYGASFSLLIWLMAVSTTHMRHTAPVFQWPCCHAQQQFEKIRMCFEFNYVHTHTHSHITFASWADRKEKRSNKHDFFCLLARKMVVRPPSTGDISFIFMAQKDKCVTVKWQKQLYTASTCFAKLAEIPQ